MAYPGYPQPGQPGQPGGSPYGAPGQPGPGQPSPYGAPPGQPSPYGAPGGAPGQYGAPGQPPYGQPGAPGQPPAGHSPYGQPPAGSPYPGQPGAPGQPSPYGAPPGQPGYPPAGQPGQPGAPKPGQPGQPGYPPAGQPGQPGGPGSYPGQPGAPGSYPGQPGAPGQPPAGHAAPGTSWFDVYFSMIQPHEHQQFQQWFFSVDTDRSGSISGNEVGSIQFNGKPLGPTVGFKLVKVFDRDASGHIDLREYSILHKFLTLMQNAFMQHDTARTGILQAGQIFTAIQSSGFQVSLPTIQAMAKKFDPQTRGLDFSTYIFICAHLAHARSIFEWNARGQQTIALTFDTLAHISTDVL